MSDWMPATATTQKVNVASPTTAYNLLKDRLAVVNGRLPDAELRAREINVQASRYTLSAFKNKPGELVLLPVYEFRSKVNDQQNRALDFGYRVLGAENRAVVVRDLGIVERAPVQRPPVRQLRLPGKTAPILKGSILRAPQE